MRRRLGNEKLLQSAAIVSRVGGFMVEFATGELQWTQQSYLIHDVDEKVVPTLSLVDGFLAPEICQRLHQAIDNARESGVGFDLELPLVTAKSRHVWIRMTGEVESDDGTPVRVVGAIQDITRRCQLERRLRDARAAADQASRSKSEFLANMSHEIRTPLNAVIGLGYLLGHTPLTEDQRQFLNKIQFAGRALLGVINNVLDLSKIEADEMLLEDEPFDLPELLRDVTQMLMPQAAAKSIDLIVQPASSVPKIVVGDLTRVRQILTNLLQNSIKFTEQGCVKLTVFCTERSAGRVRLRYEVQDTGIGIEPAACERLFMPFTQADTSTTRRFGGTGLGLSIARRFVQLMGGEIGVVSKVGAGSTFWIELPLKIAPDVEGKLRTGLGILILDTQGDSANGIAAMVRALGWSPQLVESADHLIAVLNAALPETFPDAILLDMHSRDLEAHALIARMLTNCVDGGPPSVIVVAESDRSYGEHKQVMRDSDVLLVRPVTSSALFNSINLAVSRQPNSAERVFDATDLEELHPLWLNGVRVLVVDDSDINVEVAQGILTKQGARVATCSDGASALRYLSERHAEIDVVLMDVQMPVLDGNETTRRIRRDMQLTNLPIVALTAGALVGERQRTLEAGMNDFVSKPFDPQVLIRKVRKLVEQARGVPIPMVFEDRQAKARSDEDPAMKCIDPAVVQQMFGDDLALFRSLLGRMLREYADLALLPSIPVDDGEEYARLKQRTHKLKGSAGMIGATQVMRLAGAAERVLIEGRSSSAIEDALRKLSIAFTAFREEADAYLARSLEPEGAPSVTSARPLTALTHSDLDDLCELLETQNLAAVDKFAALLPSLDAVLDATLIDSVRGAVEDLNFQRGAELLRAARDGHGGYTASRSKKAAQSR